MTRTALGLSARIAALLVLGFAAPGWAQSSIIGLVQDTSSGVLPGVAVEAASEALIEGSRRTVTDDSGRYRFVDLRPGTYSITFTLQGFQTLKRSDIALPGEFTATVNAELSVGQISEAITVSVPVTAVDISSAVQMTRLDRQALDTLPIGENIWEMAAMIPGVQIGGNITGLTGDAAVGGSSGATQNYMLVHGQSAAQNVVMVDGMSVSGIEGNGALQNYMNNAAAQEVSYQTSAINADRSGGGVTINILPREGGNRFSGDGRMNYRSKKFIADNLTPRLTAQGVNSTSSFEYLSDFTISQGGPIKRNRLWFFGSYHQFNTTDLIANTVRDDGSQGRNAQYISNSTGRLTVQVNDRTKVSGYYEKIGKTLSNLMTAFDDPETGSLRQLSPNYATGAVKLTSTLSSRLLFETGYSLNRQHRDITFQEGILKERNSSEWYATASRSTTSGGGIITTAPTMAESTYPGRDNLQASLSFVTPHHNMKAGAQYQWGETYHRIEMNADLVQRYSKATQVGNEFIFSRDDIVDVGVYNTPVENRDRLVRDLGLYAQDSWVLNRLSVNYGLRWEWVLSQSDGFDVPSGRFVPARSVPTFHEIPNWKDFAPRFSVVYDLFGNSKTAVKYAVNRYNRAASTFLASTYNVLDVVAAPRTLAWTDLNGNNIADAPPAYDAAGNPTYCTYLSPGCEIDLAPLRSGTGTLFGTPADQAVYTPYERPWNFEQAVSVDHQLTRRSNLTFNWTRGSDRAITRTAVNRYAREGDYVPVTIFNPIDGTPITVYSIKDAETRARLSPGNATLSYTDPAMRSIFHEFNLQFRYRPYSGAVIFGGWTLNRDRNYSCETSRSDLYLNPNTARFCDQFNLPDGLSIPWDNDFRINATLPLKWQGLTLGITYLNNDEIRRSVNYAILVSGAAATRYPDGSATYKVGGQPAPACPKTNGCVPGGLVVPTGFIAAPVGTTLTVPLVPTRSVKNERLYQTDIKLSKTFRVNSIRIAPALNVYNLFNADHIITYSGALTTSGNYATSAGTYLIPGSILLGRVMGIAANVYW